MGLEPPTPPPPEGVASENSYPPPPSFYTNYVAPPTRPIDSTPPPYLAPLPDPLPFRRRRRSILPIVAASVGALLVIVALASGGLYLVRSGRLVQSATPAATPTNTVIPTATPFPTYLDSNPSCDNNGDWSAASNTKVVCNSSFVTITDPGSSRYLGELSFNGEGTTSFSFPSAYAVSVNLSALTNACGGMLVLGDNVQGIGLYLCQDGSWQIFIYDTTGSGKLLKASSSGAVTLASSNTMAALVTKQSVQLTINGSIVTTLKRTDTLTTAYISLAVYDFDGVNDGSAAFDSFSYHPLSVS